MTYETADDVLEHFGVKGMKWGVRKVGSGARAVGRTAKAHPRAAASVLAGAAFAATLLASHGGSKVPNASRDLTTPFLAKFGNTPQTVWHEPGPFQLSTHLR